MDEYGFGRAHVDVECEWLGLRDYLARPAILVHLSGGRDVSVSLRDSSWDDRNGRRPLKPVATTIPRCGGAFELDVRARELRDGATCIRLQHQPFERHDRARVRITARLVETVTEVHLWSETYERIVDCPIAVQADIGGSVARAIVNESPRVRTMMMTPLLGRTL